MNMPEIKVCPSTLAEGFSAYSPIALRRLFSGKKVSHILPYDSPSVSEEDAEKFIENRERLSISGVQEKLSFTMDGKVLRLTEKNEQGTFILKPIPRDVRKVDQVPANEHLTMQIARQVYGITTAENALIFFKSGEPSYITRRFDIKPDGSKWRKEDFASLSGKTTHTAGADFKYESSYEEIGALIKQYVPAWRIEIEKFFVLVLFNYIFSNGDAHLKNYGLLETVTGDFMLSPAYDLLNTRIHVSDTDFALKKGLFADGSRSKLWAKTGNPQKADFIRLAELIGVSSGRVGKLMLPLFSRQQGVINLVSRSFLAEPQKTAYLNQYLQKLNLIAKY
jgi:serine/threonine-protein kinase HipA